MNTLFTSYKKVLPFIFLAIVVVGFNINLDLNSASVSFAPAVAEACCGDDDNGGGPDDPIPQPPITCDMQANRTSIVRGESAVLTWTTANASTVNLLRANGNNPSVSANGSETVSPNSTFTFVITASGWGQTVECPVRITVTQPPAPVCELNIDRSQITIGESARLSWTSQNAVSASLNWNIGNVSLNGNRNVTPTQIGERTYTLTVRNSAGVERNCRVQVTVTEAPAIPVPVCELNANPTSINAGGSSQLSWTSQNAVSARINQGIGNVALNGNRTVNPGTTTTYTMTVTNSAGVTATCARTITVTPSSTAPVCESFTASPTTINRGNSSTLNWTSRNANSATINNGVGSVSVNGSINVSPLTTTTYTLRLTGTGGTVTCPVTVTVQVPGQTFTCENNVNFSASPRSITRGDSTTLNWSTTGVTSLYFDRGINATSLSGSVTVSPSSDTTYTMRASNGSRTISCPVTVNVSTGGGGGGGGGGYILPRCEINASVTKVNSGGAVKLTWTSRNADDIVVKDNRGNTLVDSHGKRSSVVRDLLNDNITVYPTRDTTYTVTVNRGSRDRDCSVNVRVTNDLIVKEIRDQKPVVTGISLTEVPYTGFEAGPFMTLAFYMILVLWALYLAYILVIRRTPAFASIATDAPTNPDLGQSAQPSAFVTTTATPNFHAPAVAATAVAGVQHGYGGGVVNDDVATEVENRAHAEHVLFSGEAMRYFMETTNPNNRMSVLDSVLEEAKASYPAEDGWVVLNYERLMKTCEACVAKTQSTPTPSFAPTTTNIGNSSLAEAIVTGNIVAAYQMIGNRPMIALADTAADLDALYRAKQGADVTVSKLLAHADVKTEQLHDAISALTGALDGTYTNEAEAVKMAIMKAVKAIHG